MLDKTQEIVEFAQDKINELYEEYKNAGPGEYDEHIVNRVVAIIKCLLDTAVKIEALDQLTKLDFTLDYSTASKDTSAIVDIYRVIFGSDT